MTKIKAVKAEVVQDGEVVRIELENAPENYKFIFLNADLLPTIADIAEKL